MNRRSISITLRLFFILALTAIPLLHIPTFDLSQPRPAHAATINATSTTLANAINGADGVCSLAEAVRAANTNSNIHEPACVAGDVGLDTILVGPGLHYATNDLTAPALFERHGLVIGEPLIVDGAGNNPIIVPAGDNGTATGVNTTFGNNARQGFTIVSSDVTIRNLTIDGNAGTAVNPNFQQGAIVASFAPYPATPYNNITFQNLTVQNIRRRALYVVGGGGHVMSNNTVVNVVSGNFFGTAFTIIDGDNVSNLDLTISNNTVINCDNGVVTNYFTGGNFAPRVSITNNTITAFPAPGGIAMNLSGLDGGSVISGNTIDMSTNGATDIGIVVQYFQPGLRPTPGGAVTFSDNVFLAAGGDPAMWLYHNEDAAQPIRIENNAFTATGSIAATDGEGVAIFMLDDGTPFGDEDGDSYAIILNNTIQGFVHGIYLYRNGTAPAGGRNVNATIRGNTLTANTNGIFVFENDNVANGGRRAQAIINGTNLVTGNGTGILVLGGSADIDDNIISGNTGSSVVLSDAGNPGVLGASNTGNCIINNGADPVNSTGVLTLMEDNFWGAIVPAPANIDTLPSQLINPFPGCQIPIAVDDAATTPLDTPVNIAILANDTAAPPATLVAGSVSIIGTPIGGTVAVVGGVATFTPFPGFVGTAYFIYTVQDTNGYTSNSARVTITVGGGVPPVTPPPPPPPIVTVNDPAISKIGILAPGELGLPGETITWQITVRNLGGVAASNVVVTDTLVSELRITNAVTPQGTASINGQTVTFNLGTINAGQAVQMQITTVVRRSPANGLFINVACANGGIVACGEAQLPVVIGLPDTGYPPSNQISRLHMAIP